MGTERSQLHTRFLLSCLLLAPVLVWAAHLFKKSIDSPCNVCSDGFETIAAIAVREISVYSTEVVNFECISIGFK